MLMYNRQGLARLQTDITNADPVFWKQHKSHQLDDQLAIPSEIIESDWH